MSSASWRNQPPYPGRLSVLGVVRRLVVTCEMVHKRCTRMVSLHTSPVAVRGAITTRSLHSVRSSWVLVMYYSCVICKTTAVPCTSITRKMITCIHDWYQVPGTCCNWSPSLYSLPTSTRVRDILLSIIIRSQYQTCIWFPARAVPGIDPFVLIIVWRPVRTFYYGGAYRNIGVRTHNGPKNHVFPYVYTP